MTQTVRIEDTASAWDDFVAIEVIDASVGFLSPHVIALAVKAERQLVTLFVAMTLVAVVFGAWVFCIRPAEQQREAVRCVERLSGGVKYADATQNESWPVRQLRKWLLANRPECQSVPEQLPMQPVAH